MNINKMKFGEKYKMKIAIINDEDTTTYMGGAALVNDNIKNGLNEKGHFCDILLCNKDKELPKNKQLLTYDYFIFANIAYVPSKILYFMMDNKPFMSFRHDIPIILYTQPKSIFYEDFYKTWGTMFEKAKVTVFISPMQYQIFAHTFKITKPLITPPPLDVSKFTNEELPTRNGCLYLGDINESRGCTQTMQFMEKNFPTQRKLFIGKITDKNTILKLRKMGAIVKNTIPHKDVPKLMNEYKNMFYFPNIYDSFCLKLLEAELTGMKIYSDKYRIGLYSYKDKDIKQIAYETNSNSNKLIINSILPN